MSKLPSFFIVWPKAEGVCFKNISTHIHTQEVGDSGRVQMRLGSGLHVAPFSSCTSREAAAATAGEFKSSVDCLQ